ncbi:MAG: hypothetical protein A4E32_01878 [Methanomassiliicoccales archaeon PtaU1.Bin124]|nr:MAG: hypothetical protein A4E32_01878 [Methanomassiliicoccales archaeon PtaU1.Bin124]
MNPKPLCFTCLHRENRPELGVNDQLIYCRKKDMVVRPKVECTVFYRATQQSIKELHKSLYGTIDEEGEGEI